jgi:hypothetical protein
MRTELYALIQYTHRYIPSLYLKVSTLVLQEGMSMLIKLWVHFELSLDARILEYKILLWMRSSRVVRATCMTALQKSQQSWALHCKGNSVYVFLFWDVRGLSPNFYIHVSVSDLYIPRIGPHISSSRNGSSIVGIYI